MADALAPGTTGNLFLDSLPDAGRKRLYPSLVTVQLKLGQLVYDAHEEMKSVLFPIGSVISVVLQMRDGDTAEVGLIGCEGMSGASFALGQSRTNQRSIVQIPDGALSMTADTFRAALDAVPELKAHSLRYTQAVLMMSAQIVACNVLHPVNERCARWLLMAQDRVGADLLLLTQEFLGQMLGVRRASVAIAASALQDAGFISYSRGHITVKSRLGLESVSCECYEAIQNEWEGIMGYAVRSPKLAYRPPESDGASKAGAPKFDGVPKIG